MTNNIIVYSSNFCHYCVQAKKLLERLNLSYQEINIQNFPEKREEMLKSGNELVKTAQHYVKIVHQKGKDEYDLESAVVDLKKTGLKKSRNWNSIMSMQKVNGKTMASFANIYTLTTISEGNDKGSWFTLNPQHKMVIPSVELLTECKEFHQAISDGQVKLAIPSQEPELLESSKEAENSPF